MGRVADKASIFGDISTPAPTMRQWLYGAGAAALLHFLIAWPFLPKPVPIEIGVDQPGEGIVITLSPPAPVAPVEQPEEEIPEPEVIQERADDSPPPAPPAVPRELPDLPNIRPQVLPEMWSEAGGGDLSLEEYLTLREWLREVRSEIMGRVSYPIEARQQGIGGRASLIVTVNRQGRVTDWRFEKRTEQPILDREIERALRSVRRLPPLPRDVTRDQVSFRVPIRFEIFYKSASEERAARRTQAPDASSAAPQDPGLSISVMSTCAAKANELEGLRADLSRLQTELTDMRDEYERLAERAERSGGGSNLRLRSITRRYDESYAAYEQQIAAFNSLATSFSASCQSGSAQWETYSTACRPYAAGRNAYCEAFGSFWFRLKAGE